MLGGTDGRLDVQCTKARVNHFEIGLIGLLCEEHMDERLEEGRTVAA